MTLANQTSTNYNFYLKILAALATSAAVASIFMNTAPATAAATTKLTTVVVVSTPSILPALLIIGAVLLLTAYLISQSDYSSTRSSSRSNYSGGSWYFPFLFASSWSNRSASCSDRGFFGQRTHAHPSVQPTTHTHGWTGSYHQPETSHGHP